MNYSAAEQDHNLEQMELVLEMFEKNTKVVAEPLFTLVIILYTVLVSAAGMGIVSLSVTCESECENVSIDSHCEFVILIRVCLHMCICVGRAT